MMRVLISPSGQISGLAHPDYAPEQGWKSLPLPVGYTDADFDFLVIANGAVVVDGVARLSQAKAARIATIKQEAAAHLDAIAWKLERAREREQAGWQHQADVVVVLAEREAVRRSSNAAEAAVLALTDQAEVQAFTWLPDDVAVPAPRLLTHEDFIRRFTPAEWEAMTDAARSNASMDAWMRRFSLANNINLDDPATVAGVQALEIAGILAIGRAAEILGVA